MKILVTLEQWENNQLEVLLVLLDKSEIEGLAWEMIDPEEIWQTKDLELLEKEIQ